MVKGLKSLQRKLAVTIPARVKKLTRSALAVWADKTVASAEAFAPELTGSLVNSIGWVWGNTPPKGSISIGTIDGGDPDLTITIFAGDDESYYARWQEFGTVNMAANPFFFPAVRLNARAGRARVRRAIRQGIKEGAR